MKACPYCGKKTARIGMHIGRFHTPERAPKRGRPPKMVLPVEETESTQRVVMEVRVRR